MQSFLTRLYPKIDQLESIDKPGPWLRRSLHNLYIDEYRRQVRENTIFCHEEPIDESADDDTDMTFAQVSNVELRGRLQDALEQINPDQRIVVLLHHAEGYTLEEVAEMLEVPLGTLKSRLHRAHKELKKLISTEPFVEPGRVKGIER